MVNVFFSERHDGEAQKLARETCDSCPVFDDCRSYIESNNERYGIWAGRSGDKYRRELSEQNAENERKGITHGNPRMFRKGCRCEPCVQGHRAYNRELYRRSKSTVSVRKKPKPMVHGERATYFRGCRCDECRAAQAAYMREYKRRIRAGIQVGA